MTIRTQDVAVGAHPSAAMTREEAVARARACAPLIRERAAEAERLRRQPAETIADLSASGLTRLLTPRRWGGYELSFDAMVDAAIEIGKADGSAAWCYAFLATHPWILAHFPEEAQRDVWAGAPDARLATSFIPAGQPTPIAGGYRLSGNWPWVSGIDHCGWAVLAGLVPPAAESERPEPRLFLVPRSDYAIEDTWFVAGQRGTGSKNVVVADAFVPAHRTLRFEDFRDGHAPGATVNSGPLYNLPAIAAFPAALTAPLLGATRGAYETWRETSRTKVTMHSREQVAALSHQQIRLAETAAEIDAAELLLRRALDVLRPGGPLTLEQRVRNRRDYAYGATLCVRAVERLFLASGGGAHYDTHPLQRYWRDVHAMGAHALLNLDAAGENFGRLELGLPLNSHDPNF